MNIGWYTEEEQSIYIGKLSKYRRLIAKGVDSITASEICAKEIISDETGSGDALENRFLQSSDPIKSFGQHVRRIDDVCAGNVPKADCKQSELPFYKILPY